MKKVFKLMTLTLACALILVGCRANQVGFDDEKVDTDKVVSEQEGIQEERESISYEKEDFVIEYEEENAPVVTIDIEEYGVIKAELYPSLAPNTVNNFIYLANTGYYDGLTFHRIIENFMIQGGCPDGIGTGNPGYSIVGEFANNGYANNLAHTPGVLSMARSMMPDSAGSQFFIMTSDSPHLDGDYAAFGKVTEGMDIVYEMSQVPTNINDKPIQPITIKSITVDTLGITYEEPIRLD